MGTYFKSGTWNCICDVCGFKFKSDQVRKRWDGLMVCDKDYEARHPMDFMRVGSRERAVPFTRPEPTDVFVSGPTCSIESRQGVAGLGTAGCAAAGFVVPT